MFKDSKGKKEQERNLIEKFSRFNEQIPSSRIPKTSKTQVPVQHENRESTKEEYEESLKGIKERIQNLDNEIFEMKGKNLGWGKEEHKEFLVILNRWKVHYKLNSKEIEK
jgi:hypothetical protein